MIFGVLTGYLINTHLAPADAKAAADYLSIITDIFLRLIRMIIAPLVFSTLVVGIAHMEDSAAIGRVGVKTLGWFILASLVSLTIGLIMVQFLQPGAGLALPPPNAASGVTAAGFSLKDFIDLTVVSEDRISLACGLVHLHFKFAIIGDSNIWHYHSRPAR